jgi:hypothetical protein
MYITLLGHICQALTNSCDCVSTRLLLSFRVERSTDQVKKAINLEALSKWVEEIPEDVKKDMSKIAPMLQIMGYDPHANPPNYAKAQMKIDDDLIENYGSKSGRRLKDNDD